MNGLTRDYLTNEYTYYKERASASFNKGRIENAINYLTFCSRLATAYPIIREFVDDEIEGLLTNIAETILNEGKHRTELYNTSEKRIVFYNGQVIDSGALTEQYLHFFIENDYSVLFIIPDIRNTANGAEILNLINLHDKITLFIPQSNDNISRIKEISHKIDEYRPSHAFLHFLPHDTIGFCSFVLKKDLRKYFIVHNDHTFWLGKACSDFFIEFRKFGHQLSTKRRGIDSQKILLIPFYPIVQKTPFQGFPFETKDKVIGFSAANLYKYYKDPQLQYFNAIKDLIAEYPDFIFCIAGYGNTDVLQKFIIKHKLEDRFYFLGRRNDFYSLVGNIDILFESYPFKGGLTLLYAIEQQKALTGLVNMRNASQSTSDFFDCDIDYKEPTDFNSLKIDAGQLITSRQKRIERAKLFQDVPNNKVEFSMRLSKLMNDDFDDLRREYNDELSYDDEYSLNEDLKLPKTEVDYFLRKLSMLKNELSIKETILDIMKLFRNDDFYFVRRMRWFNVFLKFYRYFIIKSR